MTAKNEPQVKAFTIEEIDRGIEKLRRRIADLDALGTQRVNWQDASRNTIELKIIETIREVFGPESPEFREYQRLSLFHPGIGMYDSDKTVQAKSEAGVPHAIKILDGLINWLEEKRQDLLANPSRSVQVTFEDLQLHPRIKEVASPLYKNGHYADAVFNASKALVNMVKEKACQHDLDGVGLMQTVFSPKAPILAFNDLRDQTDRDEQQGMMYLYAGAVSALKNPGSHAFPDISAADAAKWIGFLSLLAGRLEGAKRVGS